jgi:hypothetical protein
MVDEDAAAGTAALSVLPVLLGVSPPDVSVVVSVPLVVSSSQLVHASKELSDAMIGS